MLVYDGSRSELELNYDFGDEHSGWQAFLPSWSSVFIRTPNDSDIIKGIIFVSDN